MVSISNISSNYPETVSTRLESINEQLKDLPRVLDRETLDALRNGEYEVSLQEYTDMNTYRTTMTALYGNSSADRFNSSLNNILGRNNNNRLSAEEFLNGMEERGVTRETALRLYTALRAYSVTSSVFGNNSFVSARV